MEADYKNGCYIMACWTSRDETPEALADRFVTLIDRLRQIDPVFELWISGTKGPRNFETLRDNFAKVVRYGLTRDDFGEPEPISGYWFGAYTRGQPESRCYSINVHAGAHTRALSHQNDLIFDTSSMTTPAPSSITYPLFKAVLLAIIETWQPDDALVMPRALMDLIDLNRHFRESWMQYLAKPLAELIAPPDSVLVEHLLDGGLLMSATTDKFDVNDPAHVAGARAIGAATLPLEELPYVPKFVPRHPRGVSGAGGLT